MIIPGRLNAKKIIENNFVEAFTACSNTIQSQYGTKWITSKVPFPYYNCVMQSHIQPEECEKVINTVTQFYESRDIPFAWFVTELSTPFHLVDKLKENGFKQQAAFQGLICDLTDSFPAFEKPINCQIEKISDPALLKIWADPIQVAFSFPDDIMKPFMKIMEKLMFQERIVHYLAYWEGKLAGSASAFIGSKSIGIYNLGIYPEFRQRKMATSLIFEGCNLARELGFQHVVGQGVEYSAKAAFSLGAKSVMHFMPFIK